MSLAPIVPIGPTAASLRVQVIGAVETDLMGAVNVAQAQEALAPDVRPAAPPAPPLPSPVRQALDAARADAAGRQASLAPLFADLSEAVNAPGLPARIRAAIGQLLALRTSLAAPLTAETIRQAVAQSGLFLEAHMRQGEADQPDLKAALLSLQRALAAVPAAEAAKTTRPLVTPPPLREAALTPQGATPAALSARDEVPVIVQHLAREVAQAVARQTLHQLASLPDGQTPSWLFELPVATPQGAAIAQFEIDRDGRQSGAAAGPEAWRARFSIDIEPLGPVHVHLRLDGERTAVTVWAERPEGLERLRGLGAELAHALPAEVIFHPGSPRRPLPENGQFVDRAL
jgi:hypothetical protein